MPSDHLTNAAIADRLISLAQLLAAQKENPFKVKAYRRAAKSIRTLSESLDALVRSDADLTKYSGIGKGIGGAIRELVLSGTLRQLDILRAQVTPEVAALNEYPRLDAARVLRIFKKLKIASVEELRERLASGQIARVLGARMHAHVRDALTEPQEMLLYDAEPLVSAVEDFLLTRCKVRRSEVSGAYRRRLEVVREISFLIDTGDLPAVIAKMEQYGGGAERLSADARHATFQLSSGIVLQIRTSETNQWGLQMIRATGSDAHLQKLEAASGSLAGLARGKASYPDEEAVYRKLKLSFIPPELREGHDEIELAARGALPRLVTAADIRGELHAHSTSSDGRNSIQQMAEAARTKGYEYLGITDHSQSLKIAGGVSEEDLWRQIRFIDKLNARLSGFRILKSAEVDILADGTLDYPDDLLRELDYTVCSIHSRFALGRTEQTERLLRAMDNRYFNILGHATGRLLLKRPGYEIDLPRVIEQAQRNGCFFEINSSPDRLDLSAAHARLASEAGVKIAVSTDAHSTREYDLIRCGIDQARRAALPKDAVLNTQSWADLRKTLRR